MPKLSSEGGAVGWQTVPAHSSSVWQQCSSVHRCRSVTRGFQSLSCLHSCLRPPSAGMGLMRQFWKTKSFWNGNRRCAGSLRDRHHSGQEASKHPSAFQAKRGLVSSSAPSPAWLRSQHRFCSGSPSAGGVTRAASCHPTAIAGGQSYVQI